MTLRSLILILTGVLSTHALTDTTNAGFFKKLEKELRMDYVACTGDSTPLPVKTLIRWKHRVDSFAALPGYERTASAYEKETGRSPGADRPCAVLRWKHGKDSLAGVEAAAAKRLDLTRRDAKAESLSVYKEISSLRKIPVTFNGIPLGSSKRSFFWLAKRRGFTGLVDKGSYFVFRSVPLGDRAWLGAFYFDTLGLCRYELEGPGYPADSLDGAVRADAAYLASVFEDLIGSPPHQVNRVGRDEITAQELSIVNAWSQSGWSVAVGLSRHAWRYYAKAIVTNRPLPKK
jgi:hypothetical protein